MTAKSIHFNIKQLAPGVYSAIASDEGTAICNGIINNLPPPFNSWRFGDFFIDMNMQFLIESQKNLHK